MKGDGLEAVVFASDPHIMIHALFNTDFVSLVRTIEVEVGCGWAGGKDAGRWRRGESGRDDKVSIPVD